MVYYKYMYLVNDMGMSLFLPHILINLHLNLFVLYKCYDSSIIMYSSLLFCYWLNFINDKSNMVHAIRY